MEVRWIIDRRGVVLARIWRAIYKNLPRFIRSTSTNVVFPLIRRVQLLYFPLPLPIRELRTLRVMGKLGNTRTQNARLVCSRFRAVRLRIKTRRPNCFADT